MRGRWIGDGRGEQLAVLPLDFRDALPADHSARAFIALVEEMDLSEFYAAYRADKVGRPPYCPKSMLALVLYCNSKRIRFSREIAAACWDDIGARLIMGNQCPDRSVFDRFQNLHRKALRNLLPQTLRLGSAEGLVDLSVVAGDGTKIAANAAMSATVDEPTLCQQIADLEGQLQQALADWTDRVAEDPLQQVQEWSLFAPADAGSGGSGAARGPQRPGRSGQESAWRRVTTLRGMLDDRRAALSHQREHPGSERADWQERLARDQVRVQEREQGLAQMVAELTAQQARRAEREAAGEKIPGPRPVPVQEQAHVRKARQALQTARERTAATAATPAGPAKVNTTDPGSRIMPSKHGGFDQNHNVQALACRNQFILAITLHDNANDKTALADLLRAARDNLDAAAITDPILVALFDSGYASEKNFTIDLPVERLLVAVEKECRQTGRLNDSTTTAALAWQEMADRLADPDNRLLYKRRSAIIEPLFAQLFLRFGRTLTRRGESVETEIFLWAITHNLLKIRRARGKPT